MKLTGSVSRRQWLLATAAGAVGSAGMANTAHAHDTPLVVLVDGSIEMPQALVQDGQVLDGLQFHLAQELGQRLSRAIHFRPAPRRRIAQLLADGRQADFICNYLPGWLPGPLHWTRPYLDDADLLVTAARRPAPTQLRDVAGQRIGTVAGFFYPEAEAQLGAGFVRDDATNLIASLRKLASGRMDHALVGRLTFEYWQRRGDIPLDVHPPLVIARLRTACALSPHSSLPLAQLDAAIGALQADGSLARIVERSR